MTQKIWVGGTASFLNDWNTAANWSPSGVPGASDDVHVPASAAYAIAAYDASGTSLNSFTVDPGCPVGMGSLSGATGNYLKITTAAFSFAGKAMALIDLAASAVDAVVSATAPVSSNGFGLYLKGSALGTVSVSSGTVGVGVLDGETATVAAARAVGGNLTTGSGVTLTAASALGGNLTVLGAATTVGCYKGTLWTAGAGAIGTLTVNAGTCWPESSGTISTLNCLGGKTDTTGSGVARTVSSLVMQGGKFVYDPSVLTISAFAAPAFPVSLSATNA